MANVARTLKTTQLIVKNNIGISDMGNPIYKNTTVGNIDPEATDAAVFAFGVAVGALREGDVAEVVLDPNYTLTEEA